MNDRIKQLAEQCTEVLWRDGPYEREQFDKEKFAALLIDQCVQACINEGASYEEKAAGAYQSNLYVTAIKKHFGIEQ